MSTPATAPLLAQRYRLERRLAQGGMAEVWLATDTALSRHVAVKLLKPTLAADPVVAERFRREAIAVAGLSHPNIVAVYDTLEENGRQAVVMQLVSGKSLRQLLDDQKRLSPELTMHIGTCVSSALDTAHRGGLVHRDVKPGNILVTPDGRVMLTDFGIAKGGVTGDDLTSDNVMMGTAKYLSPEQVRGRKLDGRADLYSLGLVLYECLAGKVPFLGESDADTALARLQRDPTDLSRVRPTLPYGLAALVHRLLARDPAERPTSGAEVRATLARIQSGVDDPTTTLTPPTGAVAPASGPVPPGSLDRVPPRSPDPAAPGSPERQGSDRSSTTPRVFRPSPSRTPSGAGRPRGQTKTAAPAAPVAPVAPAAPAAPVAPGIHRSTIPGQPAPIAQRSPTPSSGIARGGPNRRDQQRWGPSLIVVGALLLIALIVSIVLWASITGDANGAGDQGDVPTSAASAAGEAPDVAPAAPAQIATITSFDPDDVDTQAERPDLVGLTRDGDPATSWTSECYSNKYMGAKQGVGLVVTLDQPATGTVTVDVRNAPYQLEVYASSADQAPGSVDGWADPLAPKSFGDEPAVITAETGAEPVRHVLVLLRELGPANDCSSNHPFRGRIGEISFTSTG